MDYLKLVVCCLVFPIILARPDESKKEKEAYIIHYEHDNDQEGGYNFAYETSDGIAREEEAEMVNAGKEDEHIVMRGSYSYVGPDGVLYTVNYIADENGFHPTGSHLPSSNLI